MKRAYCLLLLLSSLMCVGPVSAALDLELTQGVSGAQPIAIIPFVGQDRYIDDEDHSNLTTIITADLQNSGRFRVLAPTSRQAEPVVNYSHWRKRGADTLVQGELTTLPLGDLKVQISLHDLFRNKKAKPGQQQLIFEKEYTVPATQLRALAHKISDEIYQALTGDRGVFSTRIAYVLVKRQPGVPTKYILEVADADGYKPTALLVSHEPIMSPAWSSDGKRLAYVSFEQGRSQVYVADVATGARRMVADYPGINGAPSWSPDGRSLAIVLSKTGHPKIFTVDVNSKQLRQITKGWSIDTEPSWAPDGNSIVFTSDRGGSPQIYQVAIDDGKVTRLTFRGNYNARASYMPGGENIVLLTRRKGQFNIGMLDVKTGNIQLLTNAGLNESPSISPNGRMILYGTQYGGNGVLGVVSSDGRVKLRLPSHFGDVQEPAWSPYLG